jgi:hypothetical protein
LRIINETETSKRKEAISKEVQYIRKKWESMNSVQLEKKQKIEYECYTNDSKYEKFSEEEKDLILAIALGDFKMKLEKCDIRNAVKGEIFKAAMREVTKRDLDYSEAKNILLYYRFGSSKKKKRRNY